MSPYDKIERMHNEEEFEITNELREEVKGYLDRFKLHFDGYLTYDPESESFLFTDENCIIQGKSIGEVMEDYIFQRLDGNIIELHGGKIDFRPLDNEEKQLMTVFKERKFTL